MASASAAPTTHLSSDPASKDRWICIYPAYINSRKTVAEGRRIPKEKAVDNPTPREIFDVCSTTELQCTFEDNKRYTRDWTQDPAKMGRIRVQLKNSDGSPCHKTLQTRKQVMLHLGEMIPKLKSRHSGGSGAATASGGADAGGASAASGGGGSSSKKSKKKKK